MSGVLIHSPQPQRSLKRGLQAIDQEEEPPNAAKRPFRAYTSTLKIRDWVSEIPPSVLVRCRSDSLLVVRKFAQVGVQPTGEQRRHTLPSNVRWSAIHQTAIEMPPSHLNTPFKQTSSGSNADQTRTRGIGYRDTLENHGIIIDSAGTQMPPKVRQYLTHHVFRRRDSPPISQVELEKIRDIAVECEGLAEGAIDRELLATKVFPPARGYEQDIVRTVAQSQYDRLGLPNNPRFSGPPVCAPRPDVCYGYRKEWFPRDERSVLLHPTLVSYTQPARANILPFLVFELKSQVADGQFRHAINQAAGSGAHGVNSMQTLLTRAHEAGDRSVDITDTLMFSCIVDAEHIQLWVHYTKDGEFFSSKAKTYEYFQPHTMGDFRVHLRNIVSISINERRDRILKALTLIGLQPPYSISLPFRSPGTLELPDRMPDTPAI